MARLILFKAASFQDLKQAPDGEARIAQLGIMADILMQHYDDAPNPALSEGYRFPEFKQDDGAATFDHRGGLTHSRQSAWLVTKIEEYVGNTGFEAYSDLVICYCAYVPLSEQDNPWVELAPAIISLDSFWGDAAAYEAWKSQQVVTA